jgi:Zn finger protein HypA/HybF involved in hydrogenase expression
MNGWVAMAEGARERRLQLTGSRRESLMHEAGLAAAIWRAIEARGRSIAGLRIVVTGGAHPPGDVEAALRLHLAALAPAIDWAGVEIVHRPLARPCLTCGRSFEAIGPDAVCPACGGPGLPPLEAERIELEWDSGDPDGPPLRDRRPSQPRDRSGRMEP